MWPTVGVSLQEVLWGHWDPPLAPPNPLSILLSLGGWPTRITWGAPSLLTFYWVWSMRGHSQEMREGRTMQFRCLSFWRPSCGVTTGWSHQQPNPELPLDGQSTQPSLSWGEELLPTLACSRPREVRSPAVPAPGICIIPCGFLSSCLHLCTESIIVPSNCLIWVCHPIPSGKVTVQKESKTSRHPSTLSLPLSWTGDPARSHQWHR